MSFDDFAEGVYQILKVSKRVLSSYLSGLEPLSRVGLQNHDQKNLAPMEV